MNVVICGAGEVGSHAAEVLAAADHHITVIDINIVRLRQIEERLDVATFRGTCSDADVLREAGVEDADWVIAATDRDEVNLVCASIARAVGARHSIARVHHRAYFEHRGLNYSQHLQIDHLICPEYATANAIARTLRNPAAMAIEDFARGAIHMQQFPVTRTAPAVGRSLVDITLPAGSRLAAITRKGGTFVPDGTTVVERDDTVILVGNRDSFGDARRLFHDEAAGRRRVVLMGGGPMSVWLCRALRDRNINIRLFEPDRPRAEELAEKLDWVTILNADPTDRSVFDEEQLVQADLFVALGPNDEMNIIAGVLAKMRGVAQVITVVQQSKYLDVVFDIGIDRAFSPRTVAVEEIDRILDPRPLRIMASLTEGVIDVYRIRVGSRSPTLGKPLHEIKLTPDWMIAAIQRGEHSFVPKATESVQSGDMLMVIGRAGNEGRLRKLFDAG